MFKHVAGVGNVEMTPEEEAAWFAESEANDPEVNPPAAPPPHLNNGGLARFSGAAPATMLENIRMSGVTRVAKGRYRATHQEAMPSDQYSALVTIMDPNPRLWRLTARTASHVEVRTTDLAGAAQDVAEITIRTERVITP